MDMVRFVWDDQKAESNIRKHGVSFEEASTVFFDENAIEYFDPDHSEDEERFLLLGLSRKMRPLVVSYCYRQSDRFIRIISARKAKTTEMKTYEGRLRS